MKIILFFKNFYLHFKWLFKTIPIKENIKESFKYAKYTIK